MVRLEYCLSSLYGHYYPCARRLRRVPATRHEHAAEDTHPLYRSAPRSCYGDHADRSPEGHASSGTSGSHRSAHDDDRPFLYTLDHAFLRPGVRVSERHFCLPGRQATVQGGVGGLPGQKGHLADPHRSFRHRSGGLCGYLLARDRIAGDLGDRR